MLYDAVLFDADDTLFDFGLAERLAIGETLEAYGLRDSGAAEAYHEINERCWKRFERGEMTQESLKVERFRELFERFGLAADADEASEAYIEALSKKPHMLLGALGQVEAIAREKRVAIVTNGIARVQRGRFMRSPLAKIIEALVISEEVGMPKPHPSIFEEALRRLGAAAGRTLMIGDSLTSDMAGAAALGIGTCWYNPEGAEAPKGVRIDYVAKEIGDYSRYALL